MFDWKWENLYAALKYPVLWRYSKLPCASNLITPHSTEKTPLGKKVLGNSPFADSTNFRARKVLCTKYRAEGGFHKFKANEYNLVPSRLGSAMREALRQMGYTHFKTSGQEAATVAGDQMLRALLPPTAFVFVWGKKGQGVLSFTRFQLCMIMRTSKCNHGGDFSQSSRIVLWTTALPCHGVWMNLPRPNRKRKSTETTCRRPKELL